MNPFLTNTVAQPLTRPCALGWRALSPASLSQSLLSQAPLCRSPLQAMALAASLGVSFSVQAVDVNTASAQDLQRIRGVGAKTAQIIVQERLRAGDFESLQDLSERVKGLGARRLQSMQEAGLMVGSGGLTAQTGSSQREETDRKKRVSKRDGVTAQTKDATPLVMQVP